MSTHTDSHIPATTQPEVIEAMHRNLEHDEARLRLLVDTAVLAGTPAGLLDEIIRGARVFGMNQRMLDLVEQRALIAEVDNDIGLHWFGVDAVLRDTREDAMTTHEDLQRRLAEVIAAGAAFRLGWRVVEELYVHDPSPQGGRQVHAWGRPSTLLLLERTRRRR